MITLFNLNHNTSWIIWRKFWNLLQFLRFLLKTYEKNFINSSCPKHLKIINWNKKWSKFYFLTSLWWTDFISLRHQKKCENKRLMSFSPLFPLGQQGLRLHFAEHLTYAISISSTIETHKNNNDTFRITKKQYYKIILFWKLLSTIKQKAKTLMIQGSFIADRWKMNKAKFITHLW